MPKPLIVADNLSKTYHIRDTEVCAVRNVFLEIYTGELFGLFGPNGAGKSTLVRMLATLLQPSTGFATVNGFDVVRDSQKVRSLLGFVAADERSFYGRLTPRQNLAFYAAMQNVKHVRVHDEVDRVLKLFDLQSKADVAFQSLSTGQKQRLNMARALVHDPPLLILDEPTKSMDVQTSDIVKNLIKHDLVERQGKTVIFISHELYEMDAFCDRVAILADGSIQALGTPSALSDSLPRRAIYRVTVVGNISCILPQLQLVSDIEAITIFSQGMTLTALDITLSNETSAVWFTIMKTVQNCHGRVEGYQRLDNSSLREIVAYFSTDKGVNT